MTHVDRRTAAARPQTRIADAARSILACPSGVNVVVDGIDDVLGDLSEARPGGGDLGMQDLGGVPTFSSPLGTRLVEAAHERRRTLLTLESGLGPVGSPDRDAVLTLGGRLLTRGRETCECCAEARETLVLDVDLVVLARAGVSQVRVPVEAFAASEHLLNRGYLQRSTEHANLCHQDELRRAVSTTSGTRLAEVIGVSLVDLGPGGVDVQWVDVTGSHRRSLVFPRVAASTEELGDLLRSELHAGLC